MEEFPSEERFDLNLEDLDLERLLIAREMLRMLAIGEAGQMLIEGMPSQDKRLNDAETDPVLVALERRFKAKLQLQASEAMKSMAIELDELILRREEEE
jgi:hypothetical protein